MSKKDSTSPVMRLVASHRWFERLPGGPWLFSKILGFLIPYTGTIPFRVLALQPGNCRLRLPFRRRVRNHFGSVHAIAIANGGELCTGLALFSALPGNYRGILRGLEVDYVKKAHGPLIAVAQYPQREFAGDGLTTVKGELRNQDDELVATINTTWKVGPKDR